MKAKDKLVLLGGTVIGGNLKYVLSTADRLGPARRWCLTATSGSADNTVNDGREKEEEDSDRAHDEHARWGDLVPGTVEEQDRHIVDTL